MSDRPHFTGAPSCTDDGRVAVPRELSAGADTPTMPAGVEVTAGLQQATALTAGGHEEAGTFLAGTLSRLDPVTTAADLELIEAVLLYIDCRVDDHADGALLAWARYAVTASLRLHGLADNTTVEAITALTSVLTAACTRARWPAHLSGELVDAWSLLIKANTVLSGPHAARTLLARSHRAIARHHLGGCRRATAELIRLWHTWQRHHGTTDASILYLTGDALHACQAGARANTWLRHQLARLPDAAVDAAAALYEDPDFTTPISLAAHRRVCTYPAPSHLAVHTTRRLRGRSGIGRI